MGHNDDVKRIYANGKPTSFDVMSNGKKGCDENTKKNRWFSLNNQCEQNIQTHIRTHPNLQIHPIRQFVVLTVKWLQREKNDKFCCNSFMFLCPFFPDGFIYVCVCVCIWMWHKNVFLSVDVIACHSPLKTSANPGGALFHCWGSYIAGNHQKLLQQDRFVISRMREKEKRIKYFLHAYSIAIQTLRSRNGVE